MDRMQDIARLPGPGHGSRNIIVLFKSLEPCVGSVGYYSLTNVIVLDSINFQTRRLFFITALFSHDDHCMPFPSPVYESSDMVASFNPIGSGCPITV